MKDDEGRMTCCSNTHWQDITTRQTYLKSRKSIWSAGLCLWWWMMAVIKSRNVEEKEEVSLWWSR